MDIAVIIPTIRIQSAAECIDSINLNAGIEHTIICEVDRERIGCPKMVKRMVNNHKYDMYCFLGDDTRGELNFLKIAVDYMNKMEWGLVGLNDGSGHICSHWLAHRNLLEHLGGEFFHTGYKHCYSDDELLARCKLLGRYVYAEDAKIKHLHPAISKKCEWDEDYRKVYSPEYIKHDRELFLKRKASKWQNKFL